MTAKEIADLARSTNLTDSDAFEALVRAINSRISAREAAGESTALEDVLLTQVFDTREHTRRMLVESERTARDLAALIAGTKGAKRTDTLSISNDLTHQSNHAPWFLAGIYNESVRAYERAVGLFEAVADLVRATPEEKTEALAKREAAKAMQPKKSRKRAAGSGRI